MSHSGTEHERDRAGSLTEADSQDPWFFFPEGWDWRWLSRRRVLEQVADAVSQLRGLQPSLPAKSSSRLITTGSGCIAVAAKSSPATLILDMALERLGLPVVWVPEEGDDQEPEGREEDGFAVEIDLADPKRLASIWPFSPPLPDSREHFQLNRVAEREGTPDGPWIQAGPVPARQKLAE